MLNGSTMTSDLRSHVYQVDLIWHYDSPFGPVSRVFQSHETAPSPFLAATQAGATLGTDLGDRAGWDISIDKVTVHEYHNDNDIRLVLQA